MGRAPDNGNPFRPGAGALPPVLSGRDSELSLAREMLSALASGDPPARGLLFFGPRGNGKTALLDRIAEDARERGLRAEDLMVAAFESSAELTDRLREKAGLTAARIRDVQLAGVGIAVEPSSPSGDAAELLSRWIGADAGPLVILLDEAHAVPPRAGRVFFGAVQAATRAGLPLLLLAAGTPDAPRRLRQCGTFTERALQRVPVGRLQRADTIRALAEPASTSRRPFTPDAAAFIAAAAQDYPFFIQLLGSAAWKTTDDAGAHQITVELARRASDAARTEIEAFYAERFDEARDRGVHRALAPLAERVAERNGRLDDAALDDVLVQAAGSGSAADLRHTLKDLGVLWEARPAVWEMGIPSFADHILNRLPG